jgi:hypothetical protein
MTTKSYSDLLSIIKSLCGVEFATIELARINALVNRRAKRAYRASNNWPRFITVGESRVVTLPLGAKYVPYVEAGKNIIGIFLKINAVAPFTTTSPQDINFHVDSNGANLITVSTATPVFVTYKKVLSDIYGDTTGMIADVPSEWFDYIAHGVYADYLRAEGQQEKSQLADQEASMILDDELIQVDQQGAGMTFGARYLANTAGNNGANNVLRRSQG